jgi:hypothetical protein
VKQIPVPKDGRDGRDVDADAVIASILKQIPIPKDGKDGRDAPAVDVDQVVRDVLKMVPPPLDGRDGQPGKDGKKGEDGRDGMSPENFDAEMKDGRTLVIKFSSGGREFVKELKLDVPLYRGVYQAGEYEKSDTVTYGGSLWIALKKTREAPSGGSPDWKLAVKKGADAK